VKKYNQPCGGTPGDGSYILVGRLSASCARLPVGKMTWTAVLQRWGVEGSIENGWRVPGRHEKNDNKHVKTNNRQKKRAAGCTSFLVQTCSP
jgi:hypothetical protein